MALHGIEKLIFVDPLPDVVAALRLHFEDEPLATIQQGRFEELGEFDCMVSAANSFGLMDGGVDLAISQFFGWELMDRVQHRIVTEFMGEQPVGTCILVRTGHPKHPFIAHAPTMRVPKDIKGTDNVYMAMFGVLRAIADHNRDGGNIRTVACPGLGTLTGRMAPTEAARQMRMGLLSVQHPIESINWMVAAARDSNVRPRSE